VLRHQTKQASMHVPRFGTQSEFKLAPTDTWLIYRFFLYRTKHYA